MDGPRSRLIAVMHRLLDVLFWFVVVALPVVVVLLLTQEFPSVGVNGFRAEHPGFSERAAVAGLMALYVTIVAIGLHQLRRMMGTIRRGDPFSLENVRRLRILASAFIAQPAVSVIATAVWAGVTGEGPVRFDLDIGSLLAGLCLLVLAEVFAHGASIRADVEGTV